jgi:hypothetical protein
MYKIELDVEPPARSTQSNEYADLYKALQELPDNKWMVIEIPHTEETKQVEIHNVRRAVQRWFEQEYNKKVVKAVTRVEPVTPILSKMYVKKEVI